MICIYCKCDSSGSRSIPHVLPEALAKNDLKLPRGAECDRCNEYAGRRLESNLIRYPQIAFAIQLLGAPGKRGKTRAEIGGIRRERVDANTVRVDLRLRGRPQLTDGRLRVESRIVRDPNLDLLAFRRALYHAGLNMVAALNGVEAALDPKYDAARTYVRNPSPPDTSWGYGQVEGKVKGMPRVIACGFVDFEESELIQLRVFQIQFFVDLTQAGMLDRAMRTIGGTYVSPADEPPEANLVIDGVLSPQTAV